MNEKDFETRDVKSQEDVVKFYDDYAEEWDTRFGGKKSDKIFLKDRWDLFDSLTNFVTSGKRVVELGVGTGVYLRECSEKFDSVIAVDASPKMILMLAKRIMEYEVNNFLPLVADCMNLHFLQDDSIDIIYWFALIEHIVDPDAFLEELTRLLKIGGRVVFCMPNGSSPWYSIRRKVRGTGYHCSSDHFYTFKEIKTLFNKHGFELVDYKYNGSVPGGLNSALSINTLKFCGKISEYLFMDWIMGSLGLSFIYRGENGSNS